VRPLPQSLRGHVTSGLPMMRLATVLVATAALWGVASLLARAAHDQRLVRGERAVASGENALAAGRLPQAIAHLREAVVLEPDRPAYRLALARALVADGRNKEALPYVNDVLRQAPVDGEASLVLARILKSTGATEEAEAAYARAIFGRWAPDRLAARQQARLELVALYLAAGDRVRLRATLLELSAAFPGDRALQLHAARQLLSTGAVDDAVRVLEGVVNRFADPGDALTRLAEAELRRGRHAAAYDTALKAVARDSRDVQARAVRDLTARVLSLDPSLPRLSANERSRRTRRLLADARTRLATCKATDDDAEAVTRSVDGWLHQARPDTDVGYALLAAAALRLRDRCQAPPADDAVGVVLRGLAEGDRGGN
jgi:tetratricopeptide (TPR) repeat protein